MSESGVALIKKEDFFTIPNILSYIRILMIPFYINLYLKADTVEDYYLAGMVLVLSGITDALDGIIARKTGQITDLGKLIDPVADKLTQVAVVGVMFFERPYILPLLILFVFKELFLAINNIILLRKNIYMDGALWFGKVATAVFYVFMFILVIFPSFDKSQSIPLIMITAIFQLIALVGYGRWFYAENKKAHYNEQNRMDDYEL